MLWRVVACLCLLLAPSARAQSNELPGPALHAARDPDELLRAALAAYAAEDLTKARALFEAVHRVRPSARTLRALGVLAYREARFGEAVNLLEQSLASQVKPLNGELLRGASELLGQARVLALAAERSAGTVETAARVDAQVTPPVPAPKVLATSSPRQLTRLRRTAYGLFALAGAAAVVFAVGTGLGAARLADVEDQCRESPQKTCTPERARQLERREQLDLLSGLSIGGGLLAGLSGISGTALSIWIARRPDAATSPSLRSFSAGLRLRF